MVVEWIENGHAGLRKVSVSLRRSWHCDSAEASVRTVNGDIFLTSKEEQLIPFTVEVARPENGATEGPTEIHETVHWFGRARKDVKEVICVHCFIPYKRKKVAVELICSGLADQLNIRSACAPVFGVEIAGLYLHLSDDVGRLTGAVLIRSLKI